MNRAQTQGDGVERLTNEKGSMWEGCGFLDQHVMHFLPYFQYRR